MSIDELKAASPWQPIETAPEKTLILCYCKDYEPHYFVGMFAWTEVNETRLISEIGNRRTYEDVVTQEIEWMDAPSWGATHWMSLPPPPTT